MDVRRKHRAKRGEIVLGTLASGLKFYFSHRPVTSKRFWRDEAGGKPIVLPEPTPRTRDIRMKKA